MISELDSLHTWRLFASTYPIEMCALGQDHQMSLPAPDRLDAPSVLEYMQSITAPDFEWITLLSLTDVALSRTHLLQLSCIRNLGALMVYNSNNESFRSTHRDSKVDENVTRAWSRHATESGAFSKLRVLMLECCYEATARSLTYMKSFPMLELCAIARSSIDSDDESDPPSGWRLCDQ